MNQYDVKSCHTINEIFDLIENNYAFMKGSHANLKSMRIKNFFHHGVVCVTCDIIGNEFRVERQANANHSKTKYGGWHLNLYNNNQGILTLMTLDHIIPKSKGGGRTLANSQPMCEFCNCAKGNLMPEGYIK